MVFSLLQRMSRQFLLIARVEKAADVDVVCNERLLMITDLLFVWTKLAILTDGCVLSFGHTVYF